MIGFSSQPKMCLYQFSDMMIERLPHFNSFGGIITMMVKTETNKEKWEEKGMIGKEYKKERGRDGGKEGRRVGGKKK